jgi:mono/diheme cytochrome c family protein
LPRGVEDANTAVNPMNHFATSFLFALLAAFLVGCGQDAVDQPHYEPLEHSRFFADGSSARPLVEGTVARGLLRTDAHFFQGTVDGRLATTFPPRLFEEDDATARLLARGQERYTIFCTPCHGLTGEGDGMAVRRGFPAPPSLVDGEGGERLRAAPVGHFYDVVTNGIGRMPDYATQITPDDRWAVVAYVRALQLSQHAAAAQMPDDVAQRLRQANSRASGGR